MDKKIQIIQAAMKLLAENGVQATPLSAIAKAANTGMGTIYNYFPTKEALINAIYLHIKGSEFNLLATAEDESKALKVRLFHFYSAFVEFYLKYPNSFAFMDQFHSSPIITEVTKEEESQFFTSDQPVETGAERWTDQRNRTGFPASFFSRHHYYVCTLGAGSTKVAP